MREQEHALDRDKGRRRKVAGPIGVYALIQSFGRGWGELPGPRDMPVLGPGYMARNVDGIDANIEGYGGWGVTGCLSEV